MTDLPATLEAVRALSAPSREVDLRIHGTMGLCGRYARLNRVMDHLLTDNGATAVLPYYTSSVDAAKALMPEGYVVIVIIGPDGSTSAEVYREEDYQLEEQHVLLAEVAFNEAAARTAAALAAEIERTKP